eukprot:4338845-Amphidinium_carterae.2
MDDDDDDADDADDDDDDDDGATAVWNNFCVEGFNLATWKRVLACVGPGSWMVPCLLAVVPLWRVRLRVKYYSHRRLSSNASVCLVCLDFSMAMREISNLGCPHLQNGGSEEMRCRTGNKN